MRALLVMQFVKIRSVKLFTCLVRLYPTRPVAWAYNINMETGVEIEDQEKDGLKA